MMKVIAQKHVGGSCQLSNRLQRRMRIDYCHYHQPAGIRGPKHSDTAVVVRDIFDHPIDRVVSVSAFVDHRGIAGPARWTLHHELPFGLELAPNVLESEDESFLNQFLQRTRKAAINIIDAVWSAIKKNRQRIAM